MITKVSNTSVMQGKKIDLNSPEFYRTHPDLAPRNVYLQMGRVMREKDAQRIVENFGEPLWVRAKNWFKYKIEDMFSKK